MTKLEEIERSTAASKRAWLMAQQRGVRVYIVRYANDFLVTPTPAPHERLFGYHTPLWEAEILPSCAP